MKTNEMSIEQLERMVDWLTNYEMNPIVAGWIKEDLMERKNEVL
jgi:hypothetical protein